MSQPSASRASSPALAPPLVRLEVRAGTARPTVYESVRSLDDFQPWLDQVVHFPEEVIDRAWRGIPPEWIDGEEDALDRLLEQLWDRRKLVPQLIEASRQSKTNPFPNW